MQYICIELKNNGYMKRTAKYRMGCSGSGWGIWNSETGEKIEGCGTRLNALERLYELNGWRKPEKWY